MAPSRAVVYLILPLVVRIGCSDVPEKTRTVSLRLTSRNEIISFVDERHAEAGSSLLRMAGANRWVKEAADPSTASSVADSSEAEEHQEGAESVDEPAEGNEEEGEETFTSADIEVSCMLLGGVCFILVLFMLVNYPDDDIRRYSWKIISTTISIFTSVLLFQGVNQTMMGILRYFDVPEGMACLCHFLHCFVYIVLMRLLIGYISGMICGSATDNADISSERWCINDTMRSDHETIVETNQVRNTTGHKSVIIDEYDMEVTVQKRYLDYEIRKRRIRCYATLLAHMAGFAAISAGAALQQLEFFSTNPATTFIPVVITTVFVMVVFKIARFLEEYQHDGSGGAVLELHNEEIEEAESDILSLAISFLTVQVIRYQIGGILPNEEGLEVPEVAHHVGKVFCLYGVGVCFAFSAVAMVMFLSRTAQFMTMLQKRLMGTLLNALAMDFAWCFLWATRWECKRMPIFQMPSVMGRVMLALELSAFAFAMVRALDIIDDMHSGSEDSKVGAQAIQVIINALGILVGFSWEHCFDGGVAAVASLTKHPETVKLGLAICVAVLIVRPWRRHILTKVMQLQETKEIQMAVRRRKAHCKGVAVGLYDTVGQSDAPTFRELYSGVPADDSTPRSSEVALIIQDDHFNI